MRCYLFAGLTMASLICASSANAALIAYDGFDYDTSSSTALVGASGGTGWTSAWFNQGTVSPANHVLSNDGNSLTSPVTGGLPSIGERVVSVGDGGGGSNDHRVARSFPTFDVDSDSTLYLSVLFKKTNNSPSSANNLEVDLRNSSGSSSTWVRTGSTSGDELLVRPNTNQVGTAPPFAEGETYLLVLRVNGSSTPNGDSVDVLRLSSADTLGAEPASWDLSSSGYDLSADLNRVQFWTGTNSAGEFDEVRLGTTWADVTSVPEPSAFLMLLSAVTTIGVARRKKR